jgi:type I restriction enzyme S subunit
VTPKTDRYDREALVKDKVAKPYKVVKPMDIVFNPSNLRWGAIGLCREKTPVLVSPIYEVVRVKDPESTSTEFLFQLLSSERQINFFATLTEGTLIERMAVKVETFLEQTVCIPSRHEDQDALAEVFSLADREIRSLAQ